MKSLPKALLVSLLVLGIMGGVVAIAAAQEAEVAVIAVGEPWVGPSTPWVFWNSNWYYNGILYGFYGPRGWWPRSYYGNEFIVRNNVWYGPRWNNWYRGHPSYWRNFHRDYRNGVNWHHGYRGHDAWRDHRGRWDHGRNLNRGGRGGFDGHGGRGGHGGGGGHGGNIHRGGGHGGGGHGGGHGGGGGHHGR